MQPKVCISDGGSGRERVHCEFPLCGWRETNRIRHRGFVHPHTILTEKEN